MKLETLPNLVEKDRDDIEALAAKIFMEVSSVELIMIMLSNAVVMCLYGTYVVFDYIFTMFYLYLCCACFIYIISFYCILVLYHVLQHTPNDPAILDSVYMKCLEMGKGYKACVISGR